MTTKNNSMGHNLEKDFSTTTTDLACVSTECVVIYIETGINYGLDGMYSTSCSSSLGPCPSHSLRHLVLALIQTTGWRERSGRGEKGGEVGVDRD